MLRWRIAILVSVAIAISYLDRQTLPVAVTAIARDIPLTNQRFSALQSAFLLSYALMYMGGGKLVDALGTRIGFAVIMAFWSLANASHALATSFAMLMASRFLLGLGEGGGFPAATRAVAEWFRGERPRHRDGHHQRGHVGGSGERASADRRGLELRRLALDFCRHRRSRIVVDVVVDLILLSAGEFSRTLERAALLLRMPRPTCAGSICCEFASPGAW